MRADMSRSDSLMAVVITMQTQFAKYNIRVITIFITRTKIDRISNAVARRP